MRSERSRTPEAERARRDRRVLEIAGAVAGLLLVAGLVLRGTVGLHSPPDERIVQADRRTGQVTAGDVALDTALSAPLFDDVHLAPGDRRAACIAIDYRGDEVIDGVLLQLSETAGSQRFMTVLDVTIERGTARGGTCAGFTPEATIASGSLARLAVIGSPQRGGWDSWTPADGQQATYRFTVGLPEDVGNDLQGDRATTDFRWIATAPSGGSDLAARLRMLLAAFARDSVIPLLALVVVAVLFLGVQDRIDRREPKLAYAPITDEELSFVHPARVRVGDIGRRSRAVGGR